MSSTQQREGEKEFRFRIRESERVLLIRALGTYLLRLLKEFRSRHGSSFQEMKKIEESAPDLWSEEYDEYKRKWNAITSTWDKDEMQIKAGLHVLHRLRRGYTGSPGVTTFWVRDELEDRSETREIKRILSEIGT